MCPIYVPPPPSAGISKTIIDWSPIKRNRECPESPWYLARVSYPVTRVYPLYAAGIYPGMPGVSRE